MTLSRRSFFTGLAAAIAAPAVVKAESLMPVKVWRPDVWRVYGVSPGVASLAVTFERAEDAFATANRIAQHDLIAFGQCGSFIDHDKRAIQLVRSMQEFRSASESYGDRPVERNFHMQTMFGDAYSGEPARFNRGRG